jgi:hypothetical protein
VCGNTDNLELIPLTKSATKTFGYHATFPAVTFSEISAPVKSVGHIGYSIPKIIIVLVGNSLAFPNKAPPFEPTPYIKLVIAFLIKTPYFLVPPLVRLGVVSGIRRHISS